MARSNLARAIAPLPDPPRVKSGGIELEELCKELERNRAAVTRANQDMRATKARIKDVLTRRARPGHRYPDARGIWREVVREERLVVRKVRR